MFVHRPIAPVRARFVISCLLVAVGLAASLNVNASTGLTISGTPGTRVFVGKPYAFTPTATAPSGVHIWFTIKNKPAWATFYSWNGKLTGTPTAANIGTSSDIIIRVNDHLGGTHLAPFSITVVASQQQPPTISGTPPTSVTAGSAYSFQPVAQDPSGKTLTFSITNKPTWASFSSATGQLSGTPTAAQDGTYSGIAIAVSDGVLSAALPAFSVTVSGGTTTTGTATVTWSAPTLNSDGSALTNLAGYEVDYGTSASALNQTVKVANPAQTSYAVSNLTSGTWYFAVQAYSNVGTVSSLSNVVSKTIQ
jgi:Putative Ig domain